MNKTLLIIFAILTNSILLGQSLTGVKANNRIKHAIRIELGENKIPLNVVFSPNSNYDSSSLKELNVQFFGSRIEDTWKLIRSEKDDIGFTHTRYQQEYKGILVEGAVYIYHFKNNKLSSVNGHFQPKLKLSTIPKLNESKAIEKTLEYLKVSEVDMDHITTELVIKIHKKKPYLCYKVAVANHATLLNKWIYVAAQSGDILLEINRTCAVNVLGTAQTFFSGAQTITTDSVSPTIFRLEETIRGNGIQTYDASTLQIVEGVDNIWNNIPVDLDQYATDAHFGAEATYDFFSDNFNRNSFDNLGGIIKSYTNDLSVGVNAYWSGSPINEIHYGNGDDENFFPLVSLEIASHELTHGVTENSAGLIYVGESGALNESFSDIFGNTIRFLNAPSVATWYIGDQIIRAGGLGTPFRNMSNPNEFGNADTYNGLFFNAGDIVHFDSGIQNYWYYLLVTGGSGSNDIGNNFAVSPIGMTDAMKITYRNLAFYLTPDATFMDARNGSEQAAIDLFGYCSTQQNQVINAWYAVGVGNNTSTEVVAAISGTNVYSCTVPLTTSFSSAIGYENFAWDFGDGGTSSLQNPLHTYTTPGIYTVSLTVTNALVCAGSDTQIISNFVTIAPIVTVADFSIGGVQAPSEVVNFIDESTFSPIAWSWQFGDGSTSSLQNPSHSYAAAGVYTVTLVSQNCAGFDTTISMVNIQSIQRFCSNSNANLGVNIVYDFGGPNGEYLDNQECNFTIENCNASTITFFMEQLDIELNYDYLFVFDGPNESAPVLATYNGSFLQGNFTSTTNSLYLKFVSDSYIVGEGFKLNYTSNLISSVNNASFASSSPTMPGFPVQFSNLSTGNIIAYNWNFGNGLFSSEQNPVNTYTVAGIFNAVLIVTFCDGTQDSFSALINVGGVGINSEAKSPVLSTYPNPFENSITFNFESNQDNLILELFTMDGKLCKQESLAQGTSSHTLTMPEIGNMFIYSVSSSSNKVSGKLVRQ